MIDLSGVVPVLIAAISSMHKTLHCAISAELDLSTGFSIVRNDTEFGTKGLAP